MARLIGRSALLILAVLAAPASAQDTPPLDAAPSDVVRQEDAALLFAMEYLKTWSSPNPAALDRVDNFYAESVLFHGERLSRPQVMAVKRRFAARWPERDYRHRPESMQVDCDADSCLVRSVFDYVAANPATGRHARGAETFALDISFAQSRLHIISESSRRARSAAR